MYLIDDLIGLALKGDDAGQILAIGGAKMRGAIDANFCELLQKRCKLNIVRRSEEPAERIPDCSHGCLLLNRAVSFARKRGFATASCGGL